MEIVRIQSLHGLTTSILEQRPEGDYTYQLNTRQFETAHREWQRNTSAQPRALGVMTLDFQRIWITDEEARQVADAIRSTRSLITFA